MNLCRGVRTFMKPQMPDRKLGVQSSPNNPAARVCIVKIQTWAVVLDPKLREER
jgi:hypothetical protein